MLRELPSQVAWIAWSRFSSEYIQCMPYVIAFPSPALISAHDLPGSSSIEPKGAADISKERSFNWLSDLRTKQFYAEQSSVSQRKYGESNATNEIEMNNGGILSWASWRTPQMLSAD